MTDVMSILFVQANILIPIFRRMSFYIVKEIVGYKEDKEIQEMLKQKYIVSNPIEKLYTYLHFLNDCFELLFKILQILNSAWSYNFENSCFCYC